MDRFKISDDEYRLEHLNVETDQPLFRVEIQVHTVEYL